MFRRTNRQRSLFEVGMLMPQAQREACRKSWAGPFREKVLPILLKREEDFAALFDPEEGRPNRSVALVVGGLLLKEMNDLTDEEALGSMDFDLRWCYAFDVEVGGGHTCQKTLHNFRAGLMKHAKSRSVFRGMTDELVRELGVNVTRQRLDSTHILSNFAILTRLGLICETIRVFLSALRKKDKKVYEGLGGGILKRHGEGSRYEDARRTEGPRRLGVVGRDVYRVVEGFRGREEVEGMGEYGLLKRVLEEQCEVVRVAEAPDSGDDDGDEAAVPVKLKVAKEVGSGSLQTPHDAGVTYSGHKGKGYEVQIAETCVAKNPVELITHVEVTASCHSDARSTVPVVEALEAVGVAPEELVADTSYSGSENAAKAAGHGVNLLAPCPVKGKPEVGKVYEAPEAKCPTTPTEAGEWMKRREAASDFQERYAIRAGIEATNSELKRVCGLGRLRVRGEGRVRMVVHLKAAACNLKRALSYWMETTGSPPGAVCGIV